MTSRTPQEQFDRAARQFDRAARLYVVGLVVLGAGVLGKVLLALGVLG